MWTDLAKRTREINSANGWEKPTWEKLPNKLMLTVTELDEFIRAAYHTTMPDDSPGESTGVELADVAIRLLDILEAIWPDAWSERIGRLTEAGRLGHNLFQPAEKVVWPILAHLCKATEMWRKEKQVDCRIAIEIALSETFVLGAELGFTLQSEIEKKLDKNAKRGHLHGKARADG